MNKKFNKKVIMMLLSMTVMTGVLPVFGENSLSNLNVWVEDPLVKVMHKGKKPLEVTQEIELVMAKNEYESYQVVLRNDVEDFVVEDVRFEGFSQDIEWEYQFVDYVDETPWEWAGIANPNTTPKQLYPYTGVPDPISNDKTREVEKGVNQPIFITAKTSKTTLPSKQQGKAVIQTSDGEIEVNITVDVYDVVVPDTTDCEFTVYNQTSELGYSFSPQWDSTSAYYGLERYSDKWWELIGNWADELIKNRQNMLLINVPQLLLDGGTTVQPDGTVDFKWDKFDEYINLYISKGFTKFAGMHLAFHWDGDPYQYAGGRSGIGRLAYDQETDKTIWTGGEVLGEDAQYWLEQYLPSLAEHLNSIVMTDGETTVYDVWYQHLFDEPSYAPNGENKWRYLVEQVRDLGSIKDAEGNKIKQLKTMDADAHGTLKKHQELASVWCPQESAYENDKTFFDEQQALGKEKFIYICVAPSAPWLNRFVSQPTLTSQLNYWYCYKNNVDSLLHWAWNVWSIGYLDGDSYLVYPDVENNSIKSSLRNEAMRDGLEDYELFSILEERDATLAEELVNTCVESGTKYSTDVDYIREVRNLLVKAAAGEAIEVPNPDIPKDPELVIPKGAYAINDTDERIKYSSEWGYDKNRSNYGFFNYEDDVHYAMNREGTAVEVEFEGTGIQVITEANHDAAYIDVYIDGEFIEKVDLRTENREPYYLAWEIKELEDKSHTLKLVANGFGAGRVYVVIDAFLIYDQQERVLVNDNNANIQYNDPLSRWKYDPNRSEYNDINGDAHYIDIEGASIEYTFEGTGIEVITENNIDSTSYTVEIDGMDMGEYSTYTAGPRLSQQVSYKIVGLDPGAHTIKMTVKHNEGEGRYFVLDGFYVLNTNEKVDSLEGHQQGIVTTSSAIQLTKQIEVEAVSTEVDENVNGDE